MTTLIIRNHVKPTAYLPILDKMQSFTSSRNLTNTSDEIWLLQHEPVYTLGNKTEKEHVIQHQKIPTVQTDRGGQITYHGPGQFVGYFLVDLRRSKLKVHDLILMIEDIIKSLLMTFGISAKTNRNAPGLYVDNNKICSLGLRIKRGCSYHGFALNVNMDLEPFNNISPCGYKNLAMSQMADYVADISILKVTEQLINLITQKLSYNDIKIINC